MSFPVLICDDSMIARKMVQRSLPIDFATDIHTAENGQQALDHLLDNEVSLLFLDLTMPVMDGVELLQEIKNRKLDVFVIVISGDVQPKMKQRVMQLGALDFLDKPIDREKLLNVLTRFGLYSTQVA